jgi:hypothetical protein
VSTKTCNVAACVSGYARRLHAVIGDRHHVAAPLGAWLLLALAGPASTGDDLVTLEEVLGCDVGSAAEAAAGLLVNPHPLVASAAAVWTAGGRPLSDRFERWQDALPPEVALGPIPDQAGLDAWAREHTFGLIKKFPVRRTDDLYLLLATALATKVSWKTPFDLAPASELGPASSWSGLVSQVLRAPGQAGHPAPGHTQFIAETRNAGDVAVHAALAQDGLLVVSVAADPAVAADDVLAAAYEVACAQAVGGPVRHRKLADLPLGPGPAWVLREERSSARRDGCTAVLPAWRATSDHDLRNPVLGFEAAKNALAPGGDPWQARQAAMASYTRYGFEAAAVTAMALALAMTQPSVHRVADLRFAHPYAVVAVTTDGNAATSAAGVSRSEWNGLPVFSAWVSEPAEATDDSGGSGNSEGSGDSDDSGGSGDGQGANAGRPV